MTFCVSCLSKTAGPERNPKKGDNINRKGKDCYAVASRTHVSSGITSEFSDGEEYKVWRNTGAEGKNKRVAHIRLMPMHCKYLDAFLSLCAVSPITAI